jgi:hypothetical protein
MRKPDNRDSAAVGSNRVLSRVFEIHTVLGVQMNVTREWKYSETRTLRSLFEDIDPRVEQRRISAKSIDEK